MPLVRNTLGKKTITKFHCKFCRAEIYNDGTYHYYDGDSSDIGEGVSMKAYWQDSQNVFYCLSKDRQYVQRHTPLLKEVSASLDAVLGDRKMKTQPWSEELNPSDRAVFQVLSEGRKARAKPASVGLLGLNKGYF